jgi:hypothetical protein
MKRLLLKLKPKELRNRALDTVIHLLLLTSTLMLRQPARVKRGTTCNLFQDRASAALRGISASHSQAHERGPESYVSGTDAMKPVHMMLGQ